MCATRRNLIAPATIVAFGRSYTRTAAINETGVSGAGHAFAAVDDYGSYVRPTRRIVLSDASRPVVGTVQEDDPRSIVAVAYTATDLVQSGILELQAAISAAPAAVLDGYFDPPHPAGVVAAAAAAAAAAAGPDAGEDADSEMVVAPPGGSSEARPVKTRAGAAAPGTYLRMHAVHFDIDSALVPRLNGKSVPHTLADASTAVTVAAQAAAQLLDLILRKVLAHAVSPSVDEDASPAAPAELTEDETRRLVQQVFASRNPSSRGALKPAAPAITEAIWVEAVNDLDGIRDNAVGVHGVLGLQGGISRQLNAAADVYVTNLDVYNTVALLAHALRVLPVLFGPAAKPEIARALALLAPAAAAAAVADDAGRDAAAAAASAAAGDDGAAALDAVGASDDSEENPETEKAVIGVVGEAEFTAALDSNLTSGRSAVQTTALVQALLAVRDAYGRLLGAARLRLSWLAALEAAENALDLEDRLDAATLAVIREANCVGIAKAALPPVLKALAEEGAPASLSDAAVCRLARLRLSHLHTRIAPIASVLREYSTSRGDLAATTRLLDAYSALLGRRVGGAPGPAAGPDVAPAVAAAVYKRFALVPHPRATNMFIAVDNESVQRLFGIPKILAPDLRDLLSSTLPRQLRRADPWTLRMTQVLTNGREVIVTYASAVVVPIKPAAAPKRVIAVALGGAAQRKTTVTAAASGRGVGGTPAVARAAAATAFDSTTGRASSCDGDVELLLPIGSGAAQGLAASATAPAGPSIATATTAAAAAAVASSAAAAPTSSPVSRARELTLEEAAGKNVERTLSIDSRLYPRHAFNNGGKVKGLWVLKNLLESDRLAMQHLPVHGADPGEHVLLSTTIRVAMPSDPLRKAPLLHNAPCMHKRITTAAWHDHLGVQPNRGGRRRGGARWGGRPLAVGAPAAAAAAGPGPGPGPQAAAAAAAPAYGVRAAAGRRLVPGQGAARHSNAAIRARKGLAFRVTNARKAVAWRAAFSSRSDAQRAAQKTHNALRKPRRQARRLAAAKGTATTLGGPPSSNKHKRHVVAGPAPPVGGGAGPGPAARGIAAAAAAAGAGHGVGVPGLFNAAAAAAAAVAPGINGHGRNWRAHLRRDQRRLGGISQSAAAALAERGAAPPPSADYAAHLARLTVWMRTVNPLTRWFCTGAARVGRQVVFKRRQRALSWVRQFLLPQHVRQLSADGAATVSGRSPTVLFALGTAASCSSSSVPAVTVTAAVVCPPRLRA